MKLWILSLSEFCSLASSKALIDSRCNSLSSSWTFGSLAIKPWYNDASFLRHIVLYGCVYTGVSEFKLGSFQGVLCKRNELPASWALPDGLTKDGTTFSSSGAPIPAHLLQLCLKRLLQQRVVNFSLHRPNLEANPSQTGYVGKHCRCDSHWVRTRTDPLLLPCGTSSLHHPSLTAVWALGWQPKTSCNFLGALCALLLTKEVL